MTATPHALDIRNGQAVAIADIATRNVVSLPATGHLGDATGIMAERRISSVLVVDDAGRAQGIVTERNILRAMQAGRAPDTPLRAVMSSPIISVPERMACQEAYLVCLREDIRHLALVDDDGRLTGLASETDFRLHMNLTALAGRRPVTAVMARSVLSLPPDAPLGAAIRMMADQRDSCVVVVDARRPVGIVTERDVVRLYARATAAAMPCLAEVMATPVLSVTVDATVNEAASRMLDARVRHLVVTDLAGELAGLISEHDLTQTMAHGLADAKTDAERAFLRGLVDAIPDLVWLKDPHGAYLACNPRCEGFFGRPEADIVGKTDYDLVEPALADVFRAGDREAMAGGGPCVNEAWITFADGHRERLETVKTPMRDGHGRLIGVLGIGHDITDRRRMEERLRLAASVFTGTHEGIVITDASARIVEVNEAFTRITGYAREEVLGRNPGLLKSGHQDEEYYRAMWQTLSRDGHWCGEVWNRRRDSTVYAEHLTISAVRDGHDAVTHYVGVFADITPLKEHEQRLERIAHYDALTGVANRVLLSDRMAQAAVQTLRAGKLMAVCYLDLDGFKPVNDSYGHEAGDRILVEMARRMNECLRGGDTIARIGGDEFVLLLLGLNRMEECEAALARVLEAIARPVMLGEQRVALSASLGVTLFPEDDADADTLLRHADQAMYQAKESGKNRYRLFDPEHDRQIKAHRERQRRLDAALERNEFVLYFQPKVNMSTGEVLGAEALIRWQHPELGLLQPADFLPDIKGSELEIGLGEWVIDTTLAQIAVWRQAGHELVVSVNIGADHLLRPDFAERLGRLLGGHPEVPPESLELEILESTAIADTEQASHTLAACRRLGVQFALDDFGTGYSSLTYFRQLPVETLKIDQSFVRNMLEDPEDLGIVESVIQLAAAFNRSVIAEGVETWEHCAALSRLRCHIGQGFGIARPMPPERLPDWIGHWREQRKWQALADMPPPTSRDDMILRTAIECHLKWLDEVADYLRAPDTATPPPQSHQCRFGVWYRGNGAMRYGHLAEFTPLDAMHEGIHALAQELTALARHGRYAEALVRVSELQAMRDAFLNGLGRLIGSARPV